MNRVHFGLLYQSDIDLLEADGVKIPSTRRLLAVPFVGKDVPSRASEFSHPDILIGLTILAFRYNNNFLYIKYVTRYIFTFFPQFTNNLHV